MVDWEKYWGYQCLTNLTGVWDNYSHNWNNVQAAFGSDGRMFLLPYSTDISADHPWYPVEWYGTNFSGNAYIPNACQADVEDCFIPELEYCRDTVIPAFRALDVNTTIVDPAWQSMDELGIMRDGDETHYDTVHSFYEETADRVEAQVQELLDCYDVPPRSYGGGGYDTGSYDPCGGSDTGYY